MGASTSRTEKRTDASGFPVFSTGDAGEAHLMAHRMLDEERHEEGRRLLGAWLSEHDSSSCSERSQWVHLQWHMAVFEIATGRLEEAMERFRREILPAVPAGEALTDAPSLLWRLTLAGASSVEIDWQPVREAALPRMFDCDHPYVALHHLLAMAGASDVEHLTRWLDVQWQRVTSESRRLLLQLGWALRSFANGDYSVAAVLLSKAKDQVSRLGGSRAQNRLFGALVEEASRRGREAIAA